MRAMYLEPRESIDFTGALRGDQEAFVDTGGIGMFILCFC